MNFDLVSMGSEMGIIAKIVVLIFVIAAIYMLFSIYLQFKGSMKLKRQFALLHRLMAKQATEKDGTVREILNDKEVESLVQGARSEFASKGMLAGTAAVEKTMDILSWCFSERIKRLRGLTLSVILAGALGTVMGFINTFQWIAQVNKTSHGAIAAGLSEALITLAIGIFLAGIALAIAGISRSWLAKTRHNFISRILDTKIKKEVIS